MNISEAVQKNSKPETSEICGDSWTISLPKTRIHTLAELVEHCQIDLAIWEVEKFIANKWEMGYRSETGEGRTVPLFQIKAFLRRKRHIVDARQEIEELKKLAKSAPYKFCRVSKPKKLSGNMLEINIPDAHFGKLAWSEETGGPNYDVKIADRTYCAAFDSLLARTPAVPLDLIVLVLGNDLLNSDGKEGQTTSGTPVSNDGRYQKTFRVVRNTAIRCIEQARRRARQVIVIMVRGNHDELSVWHLGDSLECRFHGCPDVQIENSPRHRKYLKFGKVMLMFTHGDKGKRADYPLLMATEEREMFGATRFHEVHTGHLHTTRLDELHGIRVRILPALCAADDWHAENGYVGNLRAAESYLWNAEQGLISTVFYNAPD